MDLKFLVRSNYEEVSRVLIAKSPGIIFGSTIAGILATKYRHHVDLLLAVQLLVIGGSTAAIPWCSNLPTLAAMFMLQGFGQGSYISGGSSFSFTSYSFFDVFEYNGDNRNEINNLQG